VETKTLGIGQEVFSRLSCKAGDFGIDLSLGRFEVLLTEVSEHIIEPNIALVLLYANLASALGFSGLNSRPSISPLWRLLMSRPTTFADAVFLPVLSTGTDDSPLFSRSFLLPCLLWTAVGLALCV
jgi:hypothetical protein